LSADGENGSPAGHGGEPYLVSPTSPLAQAALRTLKAAFGHEPINHARRRFDSDRDAIQKVLGADSLLLGLALPDDNAHSPNEKFNLDCFDKGAKMGALLWPELAELG
jgi:acetylornithine deacetylase/succinyl-diaminopimelate desuccinylase-like protein